MIKNYFRCNLLFFITFLLISINSLYGQCAGIDSSITICNIPDTNNSSLDLFSLLGGTPNTGGDWSSDENLPIFIGPSSNGIVNLWQITSGGIYHFTYTVNDSSCTDNQSIVTIILGGYAGEDNFQANACEDDDSVNLFQFIGSNPNPHLGGTWADVSNTGALSGSIYNAVILGPGTYTFTYTVSSVGNCPAQTSTVDLTVHPLPNPGTTDSIEICGIDDLGNYTNVDLLNYISGQDPNGVWSEDGTSELNGPNDTEINIQNIFNNSGYGFYSFSYTVFPNHPICHPETSTIPVIIRRIIDFTGTVLSIDSICEDEIDTHDFLVNFNNLPGIDNVPTYDYQISYTISGPVSFSGAAEITRANPFFSVDDNFTPTVGNYTLTIDNITVDDPEDIVCDIIWDLTTDFEIREIPSLEGASIDIPDICVGENNTVNISNANLTDGNYTITYEITGANSVSNSIILGFQNGSASFDLDNSILQNTGTTTLTITTISDDFCDNTADLSTNFEVNPLPHPDNYEIIIENSCFGEPVLVTINNISDINQLEIIYNINGANSIPDETIALNVNNNSFEFTLPPTTFTNTGTNTFNLIYVTNVETGCASQATNTKDFTLYPIPSAPQAPTPQEFCEVEEATISDLIPNGNNYLWFENQTTTTELNPTTLLNNQDYYVSIISNDGCISDKTLISVIVNQVPPVNLIQDGASFCGADNPTISDLTNNVSVTNFTVEWYDNNGNLLSEETPLSDDTIYFGYNIDQANNCEASDAIEVSVTLTNCDTENPDKKYDFFIPDGFSPNNDGLNDTFRIKNIQFIYPEYEFDIYNRYGKLLFTGDIKHPEWNGEAENSSDKIAPNGVYFYVIRFNKNNKAPKQGRLYLNR